MVLLETPKSRATSRLLMSLGGMTRLITLTDFFAFSEAGLSLNHGGDQSCLTGHIERDRTNGRKSSRYDMNFLSISRQGNAIRFGCQ
jgi:hypothetical protein